MGVVIALLGILVLDCDVGSPQDTVVGHNLLLRAGRRDPADLSMLVMFSGGGVQVLESVVAVPDVGPVLSCDSGRLPQGVVIGRAV